MGRDQFKIRIAETQDFSNKTVDFLKSFASVIVEPCTQPDLKKIFDEVDVFWFRLGFVINDSTISENSRIKAIVTPVTGIDHIDEDLCRRKNIKIICLRGEFEFLRDIRATAEHTIGLTLSLLRNIVPASNSVKRGNWNRDLFRGHELYKKKVGILGYGRLGQIVAKYFRAFGCEVFAFDIRQLEHNGEEEVTFESNITDLFSKCEIISIHVNYTKENHHLVSRDLIAKMSSDCIIVNTSRGGILDEAALLDALKQNKIRGAAIDVIQNESYFDAGAAVIKYANMNENLLITPHIGGNTYESFEKTEMFLAQKVKELYANTRNYTS